MVGGKYDLDAFLRAIEDYDYVRMLQEAEQEGKRAEDASFGPRATSNQEQGSLAYARVVGALAFFLRYGHRPDGLYDATFRLFRPLCERLVQKGQMKPSVLKMFP